MPFPTVLTAPNVQQDVALSNVPGAVISAATEWLLIWRVKNDSGNIAKINITNTAGQAQIPVDYELAPGGIFSEPLNLKQCVGIKAWCDQASGVSFERTGWA